MAKRGSLFAVPDEAPASDKSDASDRLSVRPARTAKPKAAKPPSREGKKPLTVWVTPAVWKGKSSSVKLGRPQAIVIAVPAGTAGQLKTQVVRADPLVAPFAKGQQLAVLKVSSGERVLVDVPLLALDAVEQAGVLGRAWDALRLWIK